MADVGKARRGWGDRTASDWTSLLLELARALKGAQFYEPSHRTRGDILDRAYLAWRAELERGGAVELRAEAEGFRVGGVSELLPHGRAVELAEALMERGADRLTVTPDVSRHSFATFVELLAMDPRALEERGGISNAFANGPNAGIGIGHQAPAASDPGDGEDEEAGAQPPGPGSQDLASPGIEMASSADDTAGSRDFGGSELDSPHGLQELDEAAALLDALGAADPDDQGAEASLGSALLGAVPPLEIDDDPTLEDFEDFTKPSLEEDPLEAPITSGEDERLRGLLRDLDACARDAGYEQLCRKVADAVHSLSAPGLSAPGYRALLVLSDHAAGLGGRSGVQLRVAQEHLEELCSDSRLRGLIDRACDPEGSIAVRAAQVLLQLAGRAVGPLLDRLQCEPDPSRGAQLSAIIIALGERAVPILVAAIRGRERERARVAVRLAGELQSPNVVPTLTSLVGGGASELRRDAARALGQIGNDRALATLTDALQSDREGLPEVAAYGLGHLGDERALRPLLGCLDNALAGGHVKLARSAVGALAHIGREEAVPKLVAILERRSLLRRREQRSLKLAAIDALSLLPGREARRALDRAARSRDHVVAEVARQRLTRGAAPALGSARR